MSDRERWIKETYLLHLGDLFGINMTYLHSTVGWAMTLLLGGVVYVASRPEFPDRMGFSVLLLLLVVLAHFAVRTTKAYLNVIRWSTLGKHIVRGVLADGEHSGWVDIQAKIVAYHCDWASPLSYRDIAYKLVFELGFGYFLLAILLLLIYAAINIGLDLLLTCASLLTLVAVVAEVWIGLLRSGYLRSLRPDWLARRDR